MADITGYCMKCRDKRPIGDDFTLVASGSRIVIKAVCTADGCGVTMNRFAGGIETTATTLGWTVQQVQERLDNDKK